MSKDIAYQNKDIVSKVFADNFKGKSLAVYGLDIPKIVQVLPTNLPTVEANELRIDNLFLLEDGTVAIIDYESTYSEENKVKYLNYVTKVIKRYQKEGILDIRLRMIVIYTADVEPVNVRGELDAGCLRLEIESAFLSKLDSREIMESLTNKVHNNIPLTDEELMEFIILPLTYRTNERKQVAIKDTISLARNITDETKMIFVLSGILVFSDKVIDEESAKNVREWISMTKVGRLFAEEKEKAVEEATQKTARDLVINLLKDGMSEEKIATLIPQVSLNDIREIAKTLNK